MDYWDDFYAGKASTQVPQEPSPFARWVAEQVQPPPLLVDIGSGTGRDAFWFARRGWSVLGLDAAQSAVTRARETASRDGLGVRFEVLDLDAPDNVDAWAAELTRPGQAGLVLYARFLVHALDDAARLALWTFCSTVCGPSGVLYAEFRTGKDASAEHEFGEHFRQFLQTDRVVDEIEKTHGSVFYREEGHGLAPYKSEDPHVCRLAARWSSNDVQQ
jgi:SAM-dependent methyltransferase